MQPEYQGYQDVTEACQLCGTLDWEQVSERDRHGDPLRTVACRGCGHVVNDPIPSDEELAAFYRTDYRRDYKGVSTPRLRQIWRNFGRIESHFRADLEFYRGRRHCLDLGSGSGEFMYLAQAMGIGCVGVEPNEPYAAYTRQALELDVRTQTIEETVFPARQFDLIRLSHVMEHMREPIRSLKTLREWLSDDGVLFVDVPNLFVEAAHKVRGRVFHYGHIHNFSPASFRAAASRAGLVEHPASAARYSAHTIGFFVKGTATEPGDVLDPANADKVISALRRHDERLLPEPAEGSLLGRGLTVWAARLNEIVRARLLGSPKRIADHFAGRVAGLRSS